MSIADHSSTTHTASGSQSSAGLALRIVRWSLACMLIGVSFFVVYSSSLLHANEQAGSTTGTGSGLKIEWIQDLKFGAFMSSVSPGAVTISPTGVRSVTGGIYPLNTTQAFYTQAQFKITKVAPLPDGDDDDGGDDDDNDDGDDDDGHHSDSDDHDDDNTSTTCHNLSHKKATKGSKKSVSFDEIFRSADTDDDDNGGSSDDDDNGGSSDDDDNGGSSDDDDNGGSSDDDDGASNYCNIRVSLPTNSTTLRIYNSTGQSMLVSNFTPVLSTDQTLLNVGAKLTVGANQARGLYQGKFYVTAICE